MDDLDLELLALSNTPAALRREKLRVKDLGRQYKRASAAYAKKVRKARCEANKEWTINTRLIYLWYMLGKYPDHDRALGVLTACSKTRVFFGFPMAPSVVEGILRNEMATLEEK